jgi:lysylphosphatidylglycerol synthetase-like protein (DUF2156 family)
MKNFNLTPSDLESKVKGDLLRFVKSDGSMAFSYATLQEGMHYYLDDERGFIAYVPIKHPVFARKTKRVVLSDPICRPERRSELIDSFLEDSKGNAIFTMISEPFSSELRGKGYKINCLGYEPEIPLGKDSDGKWLYNLDGNWKELDVIKRAINEAKKNNIKILEKPLQDVDLSQLTDLSNNWLANKSLNREIWMYARPPIFRSEDGVRKFFAYDSQDSLVGFAFYDPMYRDGRVLGYSANIVRCDETKLKKLSVALNVTAARKFREEGVEKLNLCIAPFDKTEIGKFHDDLPTKQFIEFARKFGSRVYNFEGLSFYKGKYHSPGTPIYFGSNSLMPINDLYLGFLASRIASGYPKLIKDLLMGISDKGISKIRRRFKRE